MSSPTPSRTGSSHSGLRRPRHEASGPQPRPQ
jgi:hypothetical protein